MKKSLLLLGAAAVLFVLIGAGCEKIPSLTAAKDKDTNAYQTLTGQAEELIMTDASGTRLYADGSYLNYASAESSYLLTPLGNQDVFMDLFLFDVKQKKIAGSFASYDPMLARINNGRLFLAYNPAGSTANEAPLSIYDIATKQTTELPLSVSIQPLGTFDADGNTLAIADPRSGSITIYDIADRAKPKVIGTQPITGRVERIRVATPWVVWLEETQAQDKLPQTNIQLYNLDTKQKTDLSQGYRIQAELTTDGKDIAYVGSAASCVIDIKKGATNVTPENVLENTEKNCSSGDASQEIVMTDFTGAIKKKIPLSFCANDLQLSKGILAWSACRDALGEQSRVIKTYDIAKDAYGELTGSNAKTDLMHPLLANGSLIYLEASRSLEPYQDRLMMMTLP